MLGFGSQYHINLHHTLFNDNDFEQTLSTGGHEVHNEYKTAHNFTVLDDPLAAERSADCVLWPGLELGYTEYSCAHNNIIIRCGI